MPGNLGVHYALVPRRALQLGIGIMEAVVLRVS